MISSVEKGFIDGGETQSVGLDTTSPMVDQFLRLLLTQLQHQDPVNPMEAREFTAQLAQMSQLEQAVQTNQALSTLNHYQQAANNTQALNLIGKEITAQGNTVHKDADGGGLIRFQLDEPMSFAEMLIYDSMGRMVRHIPLGPKPAGEHTFSWDGKDQIGRILPEGTYQAEVAGKDAKGNPLQARLYIQGKVDSILFQEGDASIMVAGVPLSMADITEVRQ